MECSLLALIQLQYDLFIKTKINVKAVFGKNVEFSNKYFKLFLGEM